jgi:predicted kinase
LINFNMSDWTQAKHNKDLSDAGFKNIKNIFVHQVNIPKEKPAKQFLLCPVGLVGAGKSTVVIPLSEKLNLVRISHDEIRKILKEKGFNYDRSKEIAIEVISDFLKDGYSVAIDANCGSKETFNTIKKLEKENCLKVVWIHINPPEEFIVNKLKNFNHSWLFGGGDEAVAGYYKYKDKYGDGTDLGIPFLYTFDTSNSNIQEQIEEAYKSIRKTI